MAVAAYTADERKYVVPLYENARPHTRITKKGIWFSVALFDPTHHIHLALHQLIITFLNCFKTLMGKIFSNENQIQEFVEKFGFSLQTYWIAL